MCIISFQHMENIKSFLDSRKPFTFDDFEDDEPANMVVAIGYNPRTGEFGFFYEFIPCTKTRPSDGRSIIVFDVDTQYPPYISPISGGIAYRAKKSEKTSNIQKPGDGCLYPPDLDHTILWKLFEVHIGSDPEFGLFVGVMMERCDPDAPEDGIFEYFQWEGDEELPPLFYGKFPKGWNDLDPEYLELHSETIALAQKAARFSYCEDPKCCVRFGCKVHADGGLCHKKEECANFNNHFDNLLAEWLEFQKKAIDRLYNKIPQPLAAVEERVILEAFRQFMGMHIQRLPARGAKRRKGIEFWMNWSRWKIRGRSDVLFMDNWKIPAAKDKYLMDAINAALSADSMWVRLLKERKFRKEPKQITYPKKKKLNKKKKKKKKKKGRK